MDRALDDTVRPSRQGNSGGNAGGAWRPNGNGGGGYTQRASPYENRSKGGNNWSPRGRQDAWGNGGDSRAPGGGGKWGGGNQQNFGGKGKGGKKGKRTVPVSKRACQKTTVYYETNGDLHVKLYDTSVVGFKKTQTDEEGPATNPQDGDEAKPDASEDAGAAEDSWGTFEWFWYVLPKQSVDSKR